MRYITILMFMLASTMTLSAQGPCTAEAVKEGKLPMADDAFSYMPPFGKPVSGKTAIQGTAEYEQVTVFLLDHPDAVAQPCEQPRESRN
jgi:hypothetical protein